MLVVIRAVELLENLVTIPQDIGDRQRRACGAAIHVEARHKFYMHEVPHSPQMACSVRHIRDHSWDISTIITFVKPIASFACKDRRSWGIYETQFSAYADPACSFGGFCFIPCGHTSGRIGLDPSHCRNEAKDLISACIVGYRTLTF